MKFHKLFSVFFLGVFFALVVLSFLYAQEKEKKTSINKLRCKDCNVLLIGIDALRADHLSAYGYFRQTPNIDRLAASGVIFKNHFSQSPTTTPSFMSILTSLFPSDHGLLATDPYTIGLPIVKLNDRVETLPQLLKEHGYTTQAMVSSRALSKELGFGKGFDSFENNTFVIERNRLVRWLEENHRKKFFLFYHDFQPHDPYRSSESCRTLYDPNYTGNIPAKVVGMGDKSPIAEKPQLFHKIAQNNIDNFWSKVDQKDPKDLYHLQALYDGAIKCLDDFVGELQQTLKENSLLDKTIIVFTSDHGEEFLDHGKFRHMQIYNELIHTPLMIWIPGLHRKITIETREQAVDILPTIFDLAGLPIPRNIRGQSLLPLIAGNAKEFQERPVISIEGRRKSIIVGDYKYISTGSSPELFDISKDSHEKHNIIVQKEDLSREMQSEFRTILANKEFQSRPAPLVDQNGSEPIHSLIQGLKRMGYGNPTSN